MAARGGRRIGQGSGAVARQRQWHAGRSVSGMERGRERQRKRAIAQLLHEIGMITYPLYL
jgi:hypothetical protein